MTRTIEIRNEAEYQRFLKALPFYRSVFGELEGIEQSDT